MTTRTRARAAVAVAAVAVSLTLVACGAGDAGSARAPGTSASPTESQRPAVDVSVVRNGSVDFEPFASIAEAAKAADVAVVGEVVGWSDGRTVTDGDDVGYRAVLRVRVPDGTPTAHDGHVHVEVGRGGAVLVDGELFQHEGAKPAYRTPEELAAAVPAGTRVIVLGAPAPSDAAIEKESVTGVVSRSGAGHPPGSVLLNAYPQGLLFETASGGFASGGADAEQTWGWVPDDVPRSEQFDHLASRLAAAGSAADEAAPDRSDQ